MTKLTTGLCLTILAAFSVIAACSDDDAASPEKARELCMKSCDKIAECFMMPSAAMSCKNNCATAAPTMMGGQTCTNASAIIAKVEECLGKSCSDFTTCLTQVPQCQGGGAGGASGGAGGASGAGGRGGAGGAGGGTGGAGGAGGTAGGSCAACVKADMCCAKALPMSGGMAQSCQYAAACNAVSAAMREMVTSSCTQLTMAFARQFPAIAECR